ncbi:hypothetical protein HEB94_004546 [Actinopolymorpha pittospori]|uniref:Uncharacterized protein n=1 Tax=Actinopolymorpha pittospori TaxID=648752 RepID=A0A927RLD4_9ACTN|nr:hypothetical protein [Actinopolymorpha pittospori]
MSGLCWPGGRVGRHGTPAGAGFVGDDVGSAEVDERGGHVLPRQHLHGVGGDQLLGVLPRAQVVVRVPERDVPTAEEDGRARPAWVLPGGLGQGRSAAQRKPRLPLALSGVLLVRAATR